MSYLALLQQARQQPDILGQIGSGLGEFARASIANAREQAKMLQEQGKIAVGEGNYEAAAKVIPQFNEAIRLGYGINPTVAPPVGAPVYKPIMAEGPRPSTSFIGPMPEVQVGMEEVGRNFGGAPTRQAIRTGLMMEKPKPIEVSGALYDPETGNWMVSPAAQTPQTRMDLQQERLTSQANLLGQRLQSAQEIASARIEAAAALAAARATGGGGREKYIWQRMPDGSMQRVVDAPGVTSAAPPKGVLGYDENGNPIGFFNMPPQAPPKGGVKARPKPKPKAPLSVVADPSKMKAIDDLVLKDIRRENPGLVSDDMALIKIQSDPELRKQFIQKRARLVMETDRARGVVPASPASTDPFEELLREAQQPRVKK